MTDAKAVIVTDHAIIRYLERRHGVDIEELRRHIAALAVSGVETGATGVIVEGIKLVLIESTVVTVYRKSWPSRDLRRGSLPADD